MIEPEVAFTDINDNMDLAEGLTCFVINRVLERRADDIDCSIVLWTGLVDRLKGMVAQPFARCSYREAIDILKASGKHFEYPAKFGLDLQTEHERFLAEEYFKRPVAVYDYPKGIKRSTCARTTTTRLWPRWMCWCPVSVSSSEAASARSALTCSKTVSAR